MSKNVLTQKIERRLEVVNASSSPEKVELYIHGSIAKGWGVSLRDVKRELSTVSHAKEIEVHIHSNGGDVFEAIAIYNYLALQRKEKITTIVDGLAASGASAIFMAGDKRIMPENTQLMIHNPWTYAAGNADDFRVLADDLEKIGTSFKSCYSSNFVGSSEELDKILGKDTYLTADESKKLGFATDVISKTTPDEDGDVKSNFDDVESIIAKYTGEPIVAEEETEQKEKSNLMETFFSSLFKLSEE